MRLTKDRVVYCLWWFSAAFLIFCCGIASEKYRLLPSRMLSQAAAGYRKLQAMVIPPEVSEATRFIVPICDQDLAPQRVINTTKSSQGLNLVECMLAGKALSVKVVDMNGNDVHQWDIDWFKMWGDAKHLSAGRVPKERPGTQVHGAFLLENGNLIFNFDHLGLVCLDFDGKIVWRLPYQTHHTVNRDDQGNLWVCGQKDRVESDTRLPNWKPPFTEDTILNISPDGKILKEWSVIDLLQKNGYEGLLYINSDIRPPVLSGDVLHLNDVEPFPARLEEGFFRKGDVVVSLRNTNTIFVFNQETEKITFVSTGRFIRQHDPDFVDGNTISLLDNHNVASETSRLKSRILFISAPSGTIETYYEGTPEHPFYTMIMGRHQWLTNGNLLITESTRGRLFEIDRDKNTIWQYKNIIDETKGNVAIIEGATRLPPSYAALFSGSNRTTGKNSTSHN